MPARPAPERELRRRLDGVSRERRCRLGRRRSGSGEKPVAVIGAGLDLGAGGAASTWARRRSAMRGSRRASPRSAATSRTPGTSTHPWPRRPRSARRTRTTSARSWPRAGSSRRSSPRRRRAAGCRSCSAATTRSRWARSAGMARAPAPGGVLWIDAHGDLNRPRHVSDRQRARNAARGRARRQRARRSPTAPHPPPSVTKAALLGVRSLDPGERELIRELGLRVYTIGSSTSAVSSPCTREALDYLRGSAFVHIWLDLDAVDPMFAPGVGTRCAAGCPTARRTSRSSWSPRRVCGLARARGGEPDPRPREPDGELAVGLVASALGARIL